MSDKAVDPGSPGASADIVVWDFGSSKRLAEHQLRLIERSHREFARRLSVVLAGLLREYVEVEIGEVTESSWQNITSEIPSPCVVFTFTASPLDGFGILDIHMSFAFAVVDKLLGGSGTPIDQARELTSIEQRLLTKFVEQIIKGIEKAWRSHAEVDFSLGSYVSAPEFLPSLGINDSVIAVGVTMKLGKLTGSLKIIYPYLMFEPVIRTFVKSQSIKKQSGDRAKMEAFLKEVALPLSARLSPTHVSVKHLLSLEPGDVLLLDNRVSDEVEITIGERCLYMGRPGSVDGRIAVKITQSIEGGMRHVRS